MKVNTDGVMLGAWTPVEAPIYRILDIGTGSGLIALMLAQRCPQAQIDAVDVEPNAVEQARQNFLESPWPNRLNAVLADARLLQADVPYDLIISNPPFFVNSLRAPSNIRTTARHADTLTHADLLDIAARLLAPQGLFSIILPVAEGEKLCALSAQYGLFVQRQVSVSFKPGAAPKRLLLLFGRSEQLPVCEQLVVESAEDGTLYSPEFQRLVADFYL